MKAAEGGTLFLDEISELPLQLQVKFLRALQEKEYTPVGTTISLPVNVRFVASTNRDLKEEIKAEKFREDLYYRLNVVEINLPPLQERQEDIPLLADHFLNKYRVEMNKSIKGIDNQAMRALVTHKWKGEVRELENVIERAVIFCQEEFITPKDLPANFHAHPEIPTLLNTGSLEDAVRNFEKDLILRTLESNGYNKEKTAENLQVGLSTLYRKLKELDIKM
jgi:transcriptional regulator with PAS, ATPase and Fis domain